MSEKNRNEKPRTERLARSKLNSIEKIISKALLDFYVSYNEFTVLISQKQIYFRLKECIRSKDGPLGNIEGDRLIEQGKEI